MRKIDQRTRDRTRRSQARRRADDRQRNRSRQANQRRRTRAANRDRRQPQPSLLSQIELSEATQTFRQNLGTQPSSLDDIAQAAARTGAAKAGEILGVELAKRPAASMLGRMRDAAYHHPVGKIVGSAARQLAPLAAAVPGLLLGNKTLATGLSQVVADTIDGFDTGMNKQRDKIAATLQKQREIEAKVRAALEERNQLTAAGKLAARTKVPQLHQHIDKAAIIAQSAAPPGHRRGRGQ